MGSILNVLVARERKGAQEERGMEKEVNGGGMKKKLEQMAALFWMQ